jgi:hypothetical protein
MTTINTVDFMYSRPLSAQSPWFEAKEITNTYTITDETHLVATGSTSFTVTLPTAVGNDGRLVFVKRAGSGTITVEGFETEQIDGQSSFALDAAYKAVSLLAMNDEWHVMQALSATIPVGDELAVWDVTANATITTETQVLIIPDTPVETDVEVTLPPTADIAGRVICIKSTLSAGKVVTITPDTGTETIDGLSEYLLSSKYDYVVLLCAEDKWHILATNVVVVGSDDANYAVTNESLVLIAGNIGEVDVTLPNIAAAAIGRTITVKKMTAHGDDPSLDVVVGGDAHIDGVDTWTLANQYDSVTVMSDGTVWHVISSIVNTP